MLFNSFDFAIFLPVVFAVYWFVLGRNHKAQNIWLLLSSYFFYGWWDPRFLVLIVFSSAIDYWVGSRLAQEESSTRRKRWLWLSVGINLSILGLFKYYNFFVDNFRTAFSLMGESITESWSLHLILPIGISFYTFQSLSYTIDIYRKKQKPTKDPIAFFAFVAFFPQLVMGPIERASNMLPQFEHPRKFDADEAMLGVRQFIWGLFKKVVIADGCAQYVNAIFDQHESLSGLTLFIGLVYFAMQVYADFSGYSDMAIGIARLFRFKLMTNFSRPYFSRSIGEFWRLWHISLMQWFRDYVYIPLGGNRKGRSRQLVNVLLVFALSGLWHGAAWTFILFGVYHGVLYCIEAIFNLKPQKSKVRWKDLPAMLITFGLVLVGFILFRAPDLEVAWNYFTGLFHIGFGIELLNIGRYSVELIPLMGLFMAFEWFTRKQTFPLESPKWQWLKIAVLVGCIVFLGSYSDMQDFIYFKF